MAVIREELVLADRFSAVFSKYLNMGRTASGTMQAAANSQNAFTEAAVQSSAALEEMAGTGSRAAEADGPPVFPMVTALSSALTVWTSRPAGRA